LRLLRCCLRAGVGKSIRGVGSALNAGGGEKVEEPTLWKARVGHPAPQSYTTATLNAYNRCVNWLKDHVYIASWLALPVTVLVGFFQAKSTGFTRINWFRNLTYFSFLSCLAVRLTPSFDEATRTWAGSFAEMLLFVIIVGRHEN
jgi:hypothetical protein